MKLVKDPSCKRETILLNEYVYKDVKRAAKKLGLKAYEYINNILAQSVGMALQYYPKHPTTRKRGKQVVKKVKQEQFAELAQIVGPSIPPIPKDALFYTDAVGVHTNKSDIGKSKGMVVQAVNINSGDIIKERKVV